MGFMLGACEEVVALDDGMGGAVSAHVNGMVSEMTASWGPLRGHGADGWGRGGVLVQRQLGNQP